MKKKKKLSQRSLSRTFRYTTSAKTGSVFSAFLQTAKTSFSFCFIVLFFLCLSPKDVKRSTDEDKPSEKHCNNRQQVCIMKQRQQLYKSARTHLYIYCTGCSLASRRVCTICIYICMYIQRWYISCQRPQKRASLYHGNVSQLQTHYYATYARPCVYLVSEYFKLFDNASNN